MNGLVKPQISHDFDQRCKIYSPSFHLSYFPEQYEKLWKVRKMERRWIFFASLTEIMRDLRFYWIILGILKALVDSGVGKTSRMWRNSYPRKRKLLFKIKKEKLKTKKLLKITRYIRWTRALSTIMGASMKLKKYVFIKTWKVAITASISENK